jgi:hypothetical protein
MPTGAGLDAQLGTKTETTVGTAATPVTQFFPFNSAGLTFTPSYIDNPGIMAGQRFKDIGSAGIARKDAGGKIEIPVMMKGFGWWIKHILGSTTTTNPLSNPTVIATTAFKQVHWPGGLRGLSFTSQIGKPEPGTGTVKPTTYNGCKITDWDLTISDNALHMLSVSVDSWNEDGVTALATAAYPAANLAFNFSHVTTFQTGGTVTTATNLASLASGVTLPSVATKLTLSGKASLSTDRYGLGNAGIKKEQLENDFFDLSGSFEGEYDSTTWDTPFRAGTTVPIQCISTFGDAGSANPFQLGILLPACKITAAPAEVSGPGLITVSGTFQVYSDGVNPPVQITLVSTDSAAW